MSANTFIKWFFRWIASFKTDFCKEIDPRHCYNLRMLACDGTHIGVSVRNMWLDPVVTTHDDKDNLEVSSQKKQQVNTLGQDSLETHALPSREIPEEIETKWNSTCRSRRRENHPIAELYTSNLLQCILWMNYLLCFHICYSTKIP